MKLNEIIKCCPIDVNGREYHAQIRIKRLKNAHVFWSVYTLDNLAELSDYYLCVSNEQADDFFTAIKNIVGEQYTQIFGCVRWGRVKGIKHDAVPMITDLVLGIWTNRINAYFASEEPLRRHWHRGPQIDAFAT